ncbi:DUF6624 domain-containing protein [Guptibacillus algicola]|uniref:DUF6624 domain-containing protein n=1 Tax=Guptibacillus algicola TaxID=225844 RepID=UPI001CD61C79|nr:DUF6624 domain-containing protein [Alkalihalobacillus algicola]MCA0988418.1 hypothetical protein [Alkalihalobacillus algicola]
MHRNQAKELIQMKERDLKLRETLLQEGTLFDGYHIEMEKIHIENGLRLTNIMEEIGWPNEKKVGKEAADAAWIILQHAISLPQLQRNALPILEEEMNAGRIEPYRFAHLFDRISFFEGNPQRYGTQFDWDAEGKMSPWKIEDEENVDHRRTEIGLSPLQEEIDRMQKEIEENNVSPPSSMKKRMAEVHEWRERVGWL